MSKHATYQDAIEELRRCAAHLRKLVSSNAPVDRERADGEAWALALAASHLEGATSKK